MASQHLVIIGGGMVGASLAIALSGSGLKITLVEAFMPKAESLPNYDDRAIALAYGSRKIFESMGVWNALADRTTAINQIHISDKGHFGFTRLDAKQQGVPALGHVVAARELGTTLLQRLHDCEDVSIIAPATLQDFVSGNKGVELVLDVDGKRKTLQADLLVAADGGKSFVREKLELPTQEWQYGQSAIVANITSAQPHQNVAFERFTENGPVALLPMSEGRSALVWTVADEQVDEVMAYSDAKFIAQFQQRFGYRLGKFTRVGTRSSYPLHLLRAREFTAQRTVVIGNAAHTLHPIAGQGFNLGIRDVAALVEVIEQALANDQNIGSDAVLAAYVDWRAREQRTVAFATDGLARVFGNPLAPIRILRNLGLMAMDYCPPAKSILANAAMGLLGRKPRLNRGVNHGD